MLSRDASGRLSRRRSLRLEAGFPDRPEQRLSFAFHHRPSRPDQDVENQQTTLQIPLNAPPRDSPESDSRDSRNSWNSRDLRERDRDLIAVSIYFHRVVNGMSFALP